MYTKEEALTLTQSWLDQIVVGLSLCPFAAPVLRANQLRIFISEATQFDAAIREILSEISFLLETDPQQVSTTLVVFPAALAEYKDLLEAADTLDALLLESDAAQFFQLATFHPQYQFAKEPADSVSHYTNRSPCPMFHILRVAEVSKAIETYPDTLSIPKKNIERLTQLGLEEIEKRWRLPLETVTLFRPVGPKELALIEASQLREFPPRLPEQPIFYPVLNEAYAIQIARDWNVKESGEGFVTRFRVDAKYAARFPVKTVGASIHQELWVPAEELPTFNRHIIGKIEIIHSFNSEQSSQEP